MGEPFFIHYKQIKKLFSEMNLETHIHAETIETVISANSIPTLRTVLEGELKCRVWSQENSRTCSKSKLVEALTLTILHRTEAIARISENVHFLGSRQKIITGKR
jgi:hypothetical protein